MKEKEVNKRLKVFKLYEKYKKYVIFEKDIFIKNPFYSNFNSVI